MFKTVVCLCALAGALAAQDRRSRIDVEHYTIDADISAKTQSLAARAAVRFIPLDSGITNAVFELNNALTVSKVTDEKGTALASNRTQSDFTVRVTFPQPLEKGVPVTINFVYDGHLTGAEDSPIFGIKFAAIHDDYAYLLYPGRWFPVSGYSTATSATTSPTTAKAPAASSPSST